MLVLMKVEDCGLPFSATEIENLTKKTWIKVRILCKRVTTYSKAHDNEQTVKKHME